MNTKKFICLSLSLFLVAFGQPGWARPLCALAAGLGYGLFILSIWGSPRKSRCFCAFVWFFLVSLVQLSWMSSSEYHGIYIWFVYLGISLWMGGQFALFLFFFPINRSPKIIEIAALASFWTLIEWSRLFIFCGFPFNHSGMALSWCQAPMQFASLAGVLGLTFWVLLTNLYFVRTLLGKKKKKALCIWLGLALCPYLFGQCRLSYHHARQKSAESYHVVLVQTGLRPEEKTPFLSRLSSFVSPLDQWARILVLLQPLQKQKLDYIILPEAALPLHAHTDLYPRDQVESMLTLVLDDFSSRSFPSQDNPYVSNAFIAQTLANHFQAEWIVGLDDDKEGENTNSAFHFTPDGVSTKRYDKQVLVPLAEYLPMRFLKPFVERYGIAQFFSPGKEATLFHGRATVSPSICYEECYSYLMRRGRIKGSNLFVNMTNDSYFPNSKLPQQHFDHGMLRAVENGVPLLRCCNTGVTAAVDSEGKVIGKLEKQGKSEWIQGALYIDLSSYHYDTLYAFWGDHFILGVCAFFLGLYLLSKKIKPCPKKIGGLTF